MYKIYANFKLLIDINKWATSALPKLKYDPRKINDVENTSIEITVRTTSDDNYQGQVVFDAELKNLTLPGAPTKVISNIIVSGFMAQLDESQNYNQNLVEFVNTPEGKQDIIVKQAVTKISASTYSKNELRHVRFEANSHLIEIDQHAFSGGSGSAITGRVELPSSLRTIGDEAFAHAKINVLTFGDQLETISINAFRFATISSLTIPSSVIEISTSAFYDSPITYLKFEGDVPSSGGRVLNIIPKHNPTFHPFNSTPIGAIQASSGATAKEWQDWAIASGQFKP